MVWEPLEHSNCVVTDHVDIDSFWDGAVGRWRDDRRRLTAMCDFLVDCVSFGGSTVLPSGVC